MASIGEIFLILLSGKRAEIIIVIKPTIQVNNIDKVEKCNNIFSLLPILSSKELIVEKLELFQISPLLFQELCLK